jgi:colicin import membrane protein
MTQSSVVASLQELARMEEERVRALAVAGECVRREAAEREQAEREEAARTREEDERRAREEAARIEGLRFGAIEAARMEAELKASAQARALERSHELEVEHARALVRNRELDLEHARAADRRARTTRSVLVGGLSALLVAVAAALYLGVLAPRQRARDAEAAAQIASRDESIADLKTRAGAAEARALTLEGDLRGALKELERLRSIEAPHGADSHPLRGSPGRSSTQRSGPVLDGFTTCPQGSQDPLCMH